MTTSKPDFPGVDYQKSGQVRRALAQLRLGRDLGQTDLITSARKELDALGYVPKDDDENTPDVGRSKPPVGRTAPTDRTVTAAATGATTATSAPTPAAPASSAAPPAPAPSTPAPSAPSTPTPAATPAALAKGSSKS